MHLEELLTPSMTKAELDLEREKTAEAAKILEKENDNENNQT